MKMQFYLLILLLVIISGIFMLKNREVTMTKETKKTFNENIYELALENNNFRKEIVTGDHSQVVLMSIPVGSDIGQEVHKVDQTLIFVQGKGQSIINNAVSNVFPNYLLFIPAGTQHNVKNVGNEPLKLFTIYAPSQHKAGTLEKEKTAY